jgi:hypothetical protein
MFNDKLTKDMASIAEQLLSEATLADAAKKLESYAQRFGGIDKGDFLKAAQMMKRGDQKKLVKFTMDLDTEPRDVVIDAVKEVLGRVEAEKMFSVSIREEIEITEADKFAGWIAMYNGKKLEITTDDAKDLYSAKQFAIKYFRVPKSKQGILAIAPAYEEVQHIEEAYSKDDIKKAVAIADKEGGNMTGAVRAIEMIKRGLSKVKEVQQALRLANEELEEEVLDEAVDAKKVVAYLVKKGNNPKEAEAMVKKEFDGAIKAYPNAPVAKIADYIRTVAEGKSDYDTYHKTFSGAMQHAYEVAEKQGYEVDPEDIDRKVAFGPKKPSKGKTNSYSLGLTKNGKPQRKALQVQVTNLDDVRYELNMYIS